MRRALLIVLLGCSNDPQPVSAVMVEIPAQPPQPPTIATVKPLPTVPPPAASAAEAEEDKPPPTSSADPWANGLPPASGVIAQPKPVASAATGICATPYWYDAQGVKHYKPQCLSNYKPAKPTKPYKTPPLN